MRGAETRPTLGSPGCRRNWMDTVSARSSAILALALAACSASDPGPEDGSGATSGPAFGATSEPSPGAAFAPDMADGGEARSDVGSGSSCVTLSTGTEVCEPFAFEIVQAEEWIVLGVADYDALAARLEPHGLRPVSISGPVVRTALVGLVAIRYHDTEIGPYREFLLQSLVQDDHPSDDVYYDNIAAFFADLPGGGGGHAHGFLMHHLTLDGDVPDTLDEAVAGGRELLGFPKVRGAIALGAPTPLSRSFTVSEHAGSDAFEVTAGLTLTSPLPVTFPVTRSYRVVTLGAADHLGLGSAPPCWIDVQRTTTSTAQLFTAFDTLTITGSLGDELEAIGFVSGWWVESPSVRGSLTRDGFCRT